MARHSHSRCVVRFVNDILLSAPSIIIGLFVYEIVGGAGWAISRRSPGAVALAVIVVPVVVRTTENMLLPGAEPAARGGPRSACRVRS